METITFDQAIELLEITDIRKVTTGDLPKIRKRALARWHPDRVAHTGDESEIAKYTRNSQLVGAAMELIEDYLLGQLNAGRAKQYSRDRPHQDPVDIIRANAKELQVELRRAWAIVKQKAYKLKRERVKLSDGWAWRDLLRDDFKEDIAGLSMISFVYGIVILIIPAIIASLIHPLIGGLVGLFWIAQALSCVLGFLPLSRFWLPEQVQPTMLWFINFGLGIYNHFTIESQASNGWLQLLVQVPALLAKAVKYLILLPAYEIAKLIVGDKRVGVVWKEVNYYAGFADWYVEDLMARDPAMMTDEQLFDLGQANAELRQPA